jgi:NADH:ubiquinone oxidoreductase subunit H
VTLTGEGFPEGRSATVTFRGDLLRPGQSRKSDVRITASATPSGRGAVAMTFDRAMERRFVGSGDAVAHTTFVGEVQVTFQPGREGSMPLSGTARDVRFDVRPSLGDLPSQDDTTRPLTFLGLVAAPDPSGRGLAVSAVDPDGRAFAAGIREGDLIVTMDGVTVMDESDLRVRGGERVAEAVVERGGRPLPPLPLDVDGLAPLGAADVGLAASLVLLGCAVLGLPATRLGVVLRWLGRLAEPRRSVRTAPRLLHGAVDALLPPSHERRGLLMPSLALLVLVLAGFGWLAFGRSLLAPDSDLFALFLCSAGALFVARAADGAMHSRAGVVGAVRGGARALGASIPALLAVTGAVIASGRFVVAEIVSDQGGAPWRWAGMRNPGLFVLGVLLVASAVPEADLQRSRPPIEGLSDSRPAPRSAGRTLLRLVEWAYLWTVCGLSVVLFLGGWRVPGVTSTAQEASRVFLGLGVAVFLVKLWVLALAVGALRRAAGRVALEHVGSLLVRWALPGGLAAVVLGTAWTAALDGASSATLADLLGYVAVMLAVVFAAYLVAALLRGRPSTAVVASVNPWL